ncbi:MAG: hypothetical protein MI741_00625, partial [Rhodospirillales bacterium]|nr:hypothetical protein [Rhodospirillales bacterium]
SQTIFTNLATLPKEEAYSDAVTPRLRVVPVGAYPEGDVPVQDMDSNGWPQTPRNNALRAMRKGFAFHIAGDQHLGSTITYGIEAPNDAGWAVCVPSVANVWPRRWFPTEGGENRKPGAPKYSGEFKDGFGNFVTVHAVSNPHAYGVEPTNIMDRAPGYGIVRFNKKDRTIRIANWPRWVDPSAADARPYPGWPVATDQLAQYGREPVAWLSTLTISGMENPVVQVINQMDGEIVYTLRIKGKQFRPWVFDKDAKYTIKVGDPDAGVWREFKDRNTWGKDQPHVLHVSFAK